MSSPVPPLPKGPRPSGPGIAPTTIPPCSEDATRRRKAPTTPAGGGASSGTPNTTGKLKGGPPDMDAVAGKVWGKTVKK